MEEHIRMATSAFSPQPSYISGNIAAQFTRQLKRGVSKGHQPRVCAASWVSAEVGETGQTVNLLANA